MFYYENTPMVTQQTTPQGDHLYYAYIQYQMSCFMFRMIFC